MKKSILLVEDEVLIAMSQQSDLERYGYDVILANSGEAAIELVYRQRDDIDLILMDIDLGSGIDGTETAERILANHHIPVVFLSNHSEPELVERTDKITSYGYVVKNSGVTVIDASIKMAFKLFYEKRKVEISENKYRTLVENIDEIVFKLDRSGVFTFINATAEKIAGYKPEDVIGRRFDEVVHRDDLPTLARHFEQVIAGEIRGSEYRVLKKSGEVLWVSSRSTPIYEGDKIVGLQGIMQDISERRQSEEELRENETRFRELAEMLPECVFESDTNMNALYMNQKTFDLFGYSSDDFKLGLNGLDMIAPEDRQRVIINGKKILEGERLGLKEYNGIKKDGTIFPIVMSVNPMNRQNTVVGYRGIIVDLTEKMQTEQLVKQREEWYRNLVNHSPDILYKFSSKHGGLFWSPRTKDVLGYDPEEIKNDPFIWSRSIHPDDQPAVQIAIQDHEKGAAFSIEYRIQSKQGDWKWLHDSFISKTILDDEVIIERHAADITERKQLEEQMKMEQWRISSIIEGNNVGTWEWNVQTGETIFNEKWADIIGYTLDELSPVSIDTWMKYTHSEDLQNSDALLNKHFNGELEYYECEARMKHKDGHYVWVLDRGKVSSWTDDGKPIWMFGTHQDITNIKQTEEALQQSSREKENLLVELQHRAKNSFSMIHSMVNLMEQDSDSDTEKTVLAEIRSRIFAISKMYELLYVNKSVFDADLGEYLNQVTNGLPFSMGKIEMKRELDPITIPVNKAIPVGLIVTELMTNSIKHAFPDNRGGIIELTLKKTDSGAIIKLRDDGIGFLEDFDEKKTQSMGLKLVDALVTQLEGKLKSEKENGTVYVIEFPII